MANEQDKPDIVQERKEWLDWQYSCIPEKIICLDEAAIKTNYTPLRGWSKKGTRCQGKRPGHWKTYTMLSYLTFNGKSEGLTFEGAVNKEIFSKFMEKVLLPNVKQGDIIIMDNLNVHKHGFNKELFIKKGVEIRYIPRYSPEFNPIEMMWSKIKNVIRKKEPREELGIWREVSIAHLDVSEQDAHGWYKESGYCH